MSDYINDVSKAPANVLDTWVRLVMYHQRLNQGDVAVILGVTDSTLSKWRKGLVVPSTDWLLQKLVHGREGWVRLMAWGVLHAVSPEVFGDGNLKRAIVRAEEEALQAAGEVVSGGPVEVPWEVGVG